MMYVCVVCLDWQSAGQFKVVHLAVIPRYESEKVCVMAVTQHGHRIYMALQASFGTTQALKVKYTHTHFNLLHTHAYILSSMSTLLLLYSRLLSASLSPGCVCVYVCVGEVGAFVSALPL